MPRRNRPSHRAPNRNRSRRSAQYLEGLREIEAPKAVARKPKPPRKAPPASSTPVVACPTGKAGFPEHEARARLERYTSEPSNRRTKPLRVYPCPRCDAWHLTSRP